MKYLAQQKWFRIAVSFVIVITAYFAYAMAVVPWIEPSVGPGVTRTVSNLAGGGAKPAYYERLFRQFFAEDSWVRKSPKMLESDQGMLLINDYRNLGDGRIELTPFAMIFFPSEQVKQNPQRAGEAIVMQAPKAVLQFDNGLDLSRAKIGNLHSGQLLGEVLIRSGQKSPGPEDDLHITTRTVMLREDRLFTEARVDFRLGPNWGGGRGMTIRLVPKDDAKIAGRRGPNVGGIQSLELSDEVRMQFQIGGQGLLPGSKGQAKTEPPETARPQTPLQIACKGPFQFDFDEHVATFQEQVDAQRMNRSGKHDRLTCERLSIFFSPKQKNSKSATRKSSARGFESLQAQRLLAENGPVVVESPATGAAARCERLEYQLQSGQIQLEDRRRVMLRYQGNTIEAPQVMYQPGEPGRLGLVEATGPGELHGSIEGKPGEDYHAFWKRELRVRPHEGRQLLSLLGDARLSHDRMGSLAAGEVWLWLTEISKAKHASERPKEEHDLNEDDFASRFESVDLRPDRMAALGDVRIDSPQLTGDPDRFEVWFQHAPAVVTPMHNNEAESRRQARESISSRPELKPHQHSSDARPTQRFDVAGRLLKIGVLMRGERAEVANIDLSGKARFMETQTAKPDVAPLVVIADKVKVSEANTERRTVRVIGAPAQVEARGLVMVADEINLNCDKNRLSIDGPGSMSMLADRDLQGQPIAEKQKIDIQWQRAMMFDGQQIAYSGAVDASSSSQRLSTEAMQVYLDRRIEFGRPPKDRREIKLHRLACQGGVLLENRTTGLDAKGQLRVESIDRITAKNLEVDHLSGKIFAEGPGTLKSVHQGSAELGSSPFVNRATATDDAQQKRAKEQLNYLEVTYQREITGNLLDRELVFTDQVHGVRGPVNGWQDSIDVDDPAGLGKNDVTITCDRLTVSQSNLRQAPDRRESRSQKKQRGPIELEAFGNTLVEGSTFTARAQRITYAEAKDLLVLEGTGRSDARLWRQTRPGSPATQAAARKILYWRSTNRVEVDDAKYLNLGLLPVRE